MTKVNPEKPRANYTRYLLYNGSHDDIGILLFVIFTRILLL